MNATTKKAPPAATDEAQTPTKEINMQANSTAAGPRKRYKPSAEGRALQKHRETAELSREELAVRGAVFMAASRTPAARKMLPHLTVELEAGIEQRIIWRFERSHKPGRSDLYDRYHMLIDLLPPGATEEDVAAALAVKAAAVPERQEVQRNQHAWAVGHSIARLVWDHAEDPEFVEFAVREWAMDAADVREISVVLIQVAKDLAVGLDRRFPGCRDSLPITNPGAERFHEVA